MTEATTTAPSRRLAESTFNLGRRVGSCSSKDEGRGTSRAPSLQGESDTPLPPPPFALRLQSARGGDSRRSRRSQGHTCKQTSQTQTQGVASVVGDHRMGGRGARTRRDGCNKPAESEMAAGVSQQQAGKWRRGPREPTHWPYSPRTHTSLPATGRLPPLPDSTTDLNNPPTLRARVAPHCTRCLPSTHTGQLAADRRCCTGHRERGGGVGAGRNGREREAAERDGG
jgi:hypothetical protein